MSKNEGGVVFTTPAGTNAEKTLGITLGNAEGTIFTVPAGQRYHVLYGRSTLVADGNAANRVIYLKIDDGSGNVRWVSRGSNNITAGQTKYVSWAGLGYDAGGQAVGDYINNLAIPNFCILEAGEKLIQVIQAGLLGDNHTARFYVLAMGVKT